MHEGVSRRHLSHDVNVDRGMSYNSEYVNSRAGRRVDEKVPAAFASRCRLHIHATYQLGELKAASNISVKIILAYYMYADASLFVSGALSLR